MVADKQPVGKIKIALEEAYGQKISDNEVSGILSNAVNFIKTLLEIEEQRKNVKPFSKPLLGKTEN